MQLESIIDKIHSLVLNNLPVGTSRSPKGWTTFNCTLCNDQRKRAGVKQGGMRITYHCFNCSFSTGWSPGYGLSEKFRTLLDSLHCDIQEVRECQILLLKYNDDLDELGGTNSVYSPSVTKFIPVNLPPNAISVEMLPETHPVRAYATERGIYDIYPLFFVEKSLKYKDRLLIPYLFNGELVGWTSRHINPPNKSFPKYLNESPSDFVFNLDSFANNERKIVIAVEGVIDAIAIDGVGVLGNEMSAEQAHLIERLGKRIIVCPDRNNPGKLLTQQAIELGWEVSFPPWADGIDDAAKACTTYGRLLTVASIMKYATSNPVKAQVRSILI